MRGIVRRLAAAGLAFGLAVSVLHAAVDRTTGGGRADADPVVLDHRIWADFLLRYLRIGPDGVHRVAYGRVTADDRAALGRYVEAIAAAPLEDLPEAGQIAAWINLYNALVVTLVLDHYPVPRILDIGGDAGPYRLPLVEIDGEALTLQDIRDRRLAALSHDPRFLYALACGAIGCPNLGVEPYRGTDLQQQLNDAAFTFVNDPRCVQLDDDRLVVSSIFHWFRNAFGGSEAMVIRHLKAFAAPELAMRLDRRRTIDGHVFDWRLNDAT